VGVVGVCGRGGSKTLLRDQAKKKIAQSLRIILEGFPSFGVYDSSPVAIGAVADLWLDAGNIIKEVRNVSDLFWPYHHNALGPQLTSGSHRLL